MVKCQLYQYNKKEYTLKLESAKYFSDNFSLNDLENDKINWLNYHGLHEKYEIEKLCKNLNVDQLCISSIFNETRRAKVEEYDDYMFFSIKSAIPTKDSLRITSEQITFVLSHKFLISFQEKPSDYFTTIRERIVNNNGVIRKRTIDFLLFRMLESIIDNYFNVIETISDEIYELEKRIHNPEDKEAFRFLEIEKRKLIELRKIVIPMRDITIQLDSVENIFLKEENKNHFVNLKFLCDSVLEEIDANKQIIDGMSNLYYAAQGQKMNEIMRILTVVSAIFIPLTFIVGVYGMNFEFMPELHYPHGYYTVVVVMFMISLGLLILFWKRGWLKR